MAIKSAQFVRGWPISLGRGQGSWTHPNLIRNNARHELELALENLNVKSQKKNRFKITFEILLK